MLINKIIKKMFPNIYKKTHTHTYIHNLFSFSFFFDTYHSHIVKHAPIHSSLIKLRFILRQADVIQPTFEITIIILALAHCNKMLVGASLILDPSVLNNICNQLHSQTSGLIFLVKTND